MLNKTSIADTPSVLLDKLDVIGNLSDPVTMMPTGFIQEPIGIVIPLMAACIIAVLSNGFVCYLILTVHRQKTATNVFLFSLCLCDIMFAGLLLPIHCYFKPSLLYLFLTIIIVFIYIANLAAATYERLVSITKPMKYIITISKSRAIRIVLFCWLLPIIYCCMPLLWNNNTHILAHKIYLVFSLVVFLILPFAYVTYVYVIICLEIRKMNSYNRQRLMKSKKSDWRSRCLFTCTKKKQSKKEQTVMQVDEKSSFSDCRSITSLSVMDSRASTVQRTPPIKKSKSISRKNRRREIRASLPFAITTFNYMFTWLPVVYLTVLDTVDRLDLAPEILVNFSIFAIALNAVSVPFIYGLLLPNFRFTIQRMFLKIRKY